MSKTKGLQSTTFGDPKAARQLRRHILSIAEYNDTREIPSEIGCDVLQKKTKVILLAAFMACTIGIGKFSDMGSLKSLLSSYESQIGRQAFKAVIPAAVYNEDALGFSGNVIVDALVGAVKNTVFSPAPYTLDAENEALAELNEYYPSKEELEAFAKENADAAQERTEDSAAAANAEEDHAIPEEGGADTIEAQGADNDIIPAVATPANGIIYPVQSLYDYTFLMNNFYITDSSTSSDASLIDGETLLNRDLTMDLSGDDPKILIYHTHSQEKFSDSRPGEVADSVVGLGNTLTDILQQKYHIQVYHDTGVYDMIDGVEDRNEAYSLAQAAVTKILAQNPSIKVVIDLHRDGVAEGTHLVTQINGKPTAKIMFFNGLCRSANNDTNGYLQNPYLTDNLAFSLQMQIKAAEKYPDFTRRIYLRDYRYNMHMCPRSLLVECGAQTNTVAEVQNAMEPLADLLYCVLSGQ